jgi:Leucine-rich repeat (LRR) protein
MLWYVNGVKRKSVFPKFYFDEFKGLKKLIYCYINIVFLFQIVHQEAFANLKIMVELDLSNNNITNIEPGTFDGNDRLQTLTLAHNMVIMGLKQLLVSFVKVFLQLFVS